VNDLQKACDAADAAIAAVKDELKRAFPVGSLVSVIIQTRFGARSICCEVTGSGVDGGRLGFYPVLYCRNVMTGKTRTANPTGSCDGVSEVTMIEVGGL
jgi:hypothetical protein